MKVRFQVPEGALQPGDVGVNPALEPAIAGEAAAIRLGAQHVHELTAPGDQFAEVLGLLRRQRADGGPHGLGEVGDDAGIERVGLGQEAGGAGEVPDLTGIDDGDREAGAGQRGRDGGFVAARGFEGDEGGRQGAQAVDEGGQSRLVVRDREGLPGGAHVDVELGLGDIEADEEVVHDPSL